MGKRLAGVQLAILLGAIVTPLLALGPAQPVAAAEGFELPPFEQVWARTDAPVESLAVSRSWLWGPQPLNAHGETYQQAPDGERQVQYFDKSRMEITDPGADPTSQWYVTNGLLATELITGRMQQGDDTFEQREPAEVNVAGDPGAPNAPTYASLKGQLEQEPLPAGTVVTQTLNRDGSTGEDPGKAGFNVTSAYYVPETHQAVASVFWEYLQSTGPVQVNNQQLTEKLFEPTFFATGFPITRPYWTRVPVAGGEQDVLVQAFQRRVLTYTPANEPEWRVEMGNVGRHYHVWRYGEEPTAVGAWEPIRGPRMGYGFNGFFTFSPVDQLDQITQSLDLVNEAGFGWIRQQVVWATLEPSPGQYDINQLATYDAIVREAAQRNIKIMFSVAKAPRWAVARDEDCHGTGVLLCGIPQDPQNFARLMTFLTNRYQGAVQSYEIWNEQNLAHETGGRVEVGPYIELLKAGYTAVKTVNPEIIVVYGGLSPTGVMRPEAAIDDVVYLERSYQHNNGEMRRYFDVLGAHPGSNNNPPDAFWPEQPGPGTGCPEADGKCWQQDQSFYFRRIEQLRGVMEQYGDADKRVWLTEFGWTTPNEAPGYGYGSVITPELQAQYLVRAFEKGKNDYPWMGVMFQWTLNHSFVVPASDEKYPWSVVLKNPDGTIVRRPAFEALKAMPK